MTVCNSGPLITLSRIGQLDLLQRYFQRIYIPKEVYEELCIRGRGKSGAREIREARWIEVREIKDAFAVKVLELQMNKGEAEVIVLAKDVKAKLVVVDERITRKVLEALSFGVIGTVGILMKAAREGHLDLREYLDRIRSKGFWLSDEVYRKALKSSEQ